MAGLVGLIFTTAVSPSSKGGHRFRHLAVRLAACQCCAFLILELIERMISDGGPLGIGLFALGITVQLLVAALLAVALGAIAGAVEALV
ncbi:MAG: hypothetical protein ACRDLB_02575, partial [Actinomycetota bacterium]